MTCDWRDAIIFFQSHNGLRTLLRGNRAVSRVFSGYVAMVMVFLSGGCIAPSSVEVRDQARLVTFGVNPQDYDLVANAMADSLLLADIPNIPRVVVMGPVDSAQCQYRFDARLLADKIQTRLVQSQRFRVLFAADAMAGRSAAHSRYDLMRLQWERESAVRPEDLRTLGGLADIDLLLFGRVSSQTTTVGNRTEVTYTYTWQLGECESGLVLWADQEQFTKAGPRIDGRFDPALARIPVLVAPTAFHAHSERDYPELVRQWREQGYGHAIWHTLEDMLYDTDVLEVVTVPPIDLPVLESLLMGQTGGVLTDAQRRISHRIPSNILVPNMNFFESKTETLRFGTVHRTTQYHVEIFLSLYELDGAHVNVPVIAKGEARADDLLTATSEAARIASDRLVHRMLRRRERTL